jgi:hypothetical protein
MKNLGPTLTIRGRVVKMYDIFVGKLIQPRIDGSGFTVPG